MFLKAVTLLILLICIHCDNSIVDYFINIINHTTDYARSFQIPTDAREYKFNSLEPKNFGKYDYIIIGAGSAGAVVANRLSENKNWNILVLEAGGYGSDFGDIPNYYMRLQFTEYNWGFVTTPQKTSCLGMVDRICPYPRGKGIGGTSLINSLAYVRGSRYDYDRWASDGNPGWSYKEVLPFFKKSENLNILDVDVGYHGYGGPLTVDYPTNPNLQSRAFLEANIELGRKVVDYNGKRQFGVSPVQTSTRNGMRESTGKVFIGPAQSRENLKIMTDSYVTKILINEHKEAYGVEFSHNNTRFIAKTKNEIILCAGAIMSPHILQLSGIGPKKHLKKHKIPVIKDLDVGKNLVDHPLFYGLVFETNYTEPVRSLKSYVKDYLNDSGPLILTGNNHALGFYKTKYAKFNNTPDLEIMIFPSNITNEFSQRSIRFTNETAEALWGNSDTTRSFFLYMFGLQAESKGSVYLKSSNPFDYPAINSNLLSDKLNKDIDTLYEGILISFDIINTDAFRKIDTKYSAQPLPACKEHEFLSKDYWYCALRQVTMHAHHPVGTCKMGPDPKKGAVVDNELKVHGIKNLRVADASVIPFTLAGHTNAPSIMIGEKVSALIKKEIPKLKKRHISSLSRNM